MPSLKIWKKLTLVIMVFSSLSFLASLVLLLTIYVGLDEPLRWVLVTYFVSSILLFWASLIGLIVVIAFKPKSQENIYGALEEQAEKPQAFGLINPDLKLVLKNIGIRNYLLLTIIALGLVILILQALF